MKKLRSAILSLTFFALSAAPLAAYASTWQCLCMFVPTGGSCSDSSAVGGIPTNTTTDSDTMPNITDTSDPKYVSCKAGCPGSGATFCSISWAQAAAVGAAITPPPGSVPAGSPCVSDNDCQSSLKCANTKCGTGPSTVNSPPAGSVAAGGACGDGNDCSGSLACAAGKCATVGGAGGAGSAPADTGPVKLTNPLKAASVPELVANILKAAIGIVGALALLIFIYGGLRWLTSAGEPAKIQEGQNAMKWAAIGLVVIFSSYTLVSFVLGSIKG